MKLDPGGPTVATEFVGTSITSYGPSYDAWVSYLPDNPHVKFVDSRQRGYVAVEVTPQRMDVAMRVVSDATDPKATLSTLRNFIVEDKRAGPVSA